MQIVWYPNNLGLQGAASAASDRILDGRVALVTRVVRGIGRAIVDRLYVQGASVVIADSGTAITGDGADPTLALALAAASGSDHAFAAKFRLYASGRWLVGVAGQRCFLF